MVRTTASTCDAAKLIRIGRMHWELVSQPGWDTSTPKPQPPPSASGFGAPGLSPIRLSLGRCHDAHCQTSPKKIQARRTTKANRLQKYNKSGEPQTHTPNTHHTHSHKLKNKRKVCNIFSLGSHQIVT